MASPKVHAISILPIIFISLIFYFPLTFISKDTLTLMSIIFFGLLLDTDHFSITRIKNLTKIKSFGDQQTGWKNYLHSWLGLIIVILVSIFITKNIFPFLAFILHILIDSLNRENEFFDESPLSRLIYLKIIKKYLPKRLTYNFNPFNQKPSV